VDVNGFTGQEYDEATGMIHFRFRELDPRSGRWDRPDPAFEELEQGNVRLVGQSTVGYAYVSNGFSTSFDPTGLAWTKASPSNKGVSKPGAPKLGAQRGATEKAKSKSKGASKAEKIARAVQIITAVTSAALSIASAIVASQSKSFGDAPSTTASNLAIASSSIGAVSTLASAGLDGKSTYGRSSSSGKSDSATKGQSAKKAKDNAGKKNVPAAKTDTTTANKQTTWLRAKPGGQPKPQVTQAPNRATTGGQPLWKRASPTAAQPTKRVSNGSTP
jgi:RHS repeat-associated protein